jgi:hypothetical protein
VVKYLSSKTSTYYTKRKKEGKEGGREEEGRKEGKRKEGRKERRKEGRKAHSERRTAQILIALLPGTVAGSGSSLGQGSCL